MKASNIFFWLLTLILVPLTFLVGGVGLNVYWDIPSAIIVFGMAFFISMAAHGPAGLALAYKVSWSGGSKAELLAAVEVFKGLQLNFILAGVFGVVTGTVAMLTAIDNLESIAKGAAVCILTGLYTIVAILLLVSPFRSRAAAKAAEIA